MEERKLREEAGVIQSLILVALANLDEQKIMKQEAPDLLAFPNYDILSGGTLQDVTEFLRKDYGKKSRGKILPPVSKERIFYHLRILKSQRLVDTTKEQREIKYELKGSNEDNMVKRKFPAIVHKLPDNYFPSTPQIFLFVWEHNRSVIKDLMITRWYRDSCATLVNTLYDAFKLSGQFYWQPEISKLIDVALRSEWKDQASKLKTFPERMQREHETALPFVKSQNHHAHEVLKQQVIEKARAALKPKLLKGLTEKEKQKFTKLIENYETSRFDKEFNDTLQNFNKALEQSSSLLNSENGRALSFIIEEIKDGMDSPFNRFLFSYLLSYDRGMYANVLENLLVSFPDAAHFVFNFFADNEFFKDFTAGEKPTPSASEFMYQLATDDLKNWVLDDLELKDFTGLSLKDLTLKDLPLKDPELKDLALKDRRKLVDIFVDIPEDKYATTDEYRSHKHQQLEILHSYFLNKGMYDDIPQGLKAKEFFQSVFLYKAIGHANIDNVIVRGWLFYSFLFMDRYEAQYLDIVEKGIKEGIGEEILHRKGIY